ncbi:MAG TPA: HAD-IA family hydrolase [Kofleriaceae bacterium]
MITFDVGQTLVELDLDFLCLRLGERGVSADVAALVAAAPAAWDLYDRLVDAGHAHPWHALMDALLAGAGVSDRADLVDWLWSEQPRKNLWRRPIPAMVELARDLAAREIRLGIVSNSEGRLAELLSEIAIAEPFAVVVDSGRFGIAKPDRRIFDHALAELGATGARALHIGDSWAADVQGALGAGWDAVWYGRSAGPVADPRVTSARDPEAARAAIERWLALL